MKESYARRMDNQKNPKQCEIPWRKHDLHGFLHFSANMTLPEARMKETSNADKTVNGGSKTQCHPKARKKTESDVRCQAPKQSLILIDWDQDASPTILKGNKQDDDVR
jgi:hypothetical protein